MIDNLLGAEVIGIEAHAVDEARPHRRRIVDPLRAGKMSEDHGHPFLNRVGDRIDPVGKVAADDGARSGLYAQCWLVETDCLDSRRAVGVNQQF